MAQIIALDTATDACSVALHCDAGKFDRFEIAPRQHTHLLLPMVEAVLAEAQLRVKDLDLVAFGRGPGSFAGIRIATGAAQGLALAYETPVVGVSTLEAMAWRALEEAPSAEYILTALDARMDEVYWCCYRAADGELKSLHEERVSAPADVALAVDGNWILAGSGAVYLANSSKIEASVVRCLPEVYPVARIMVQLAEREFNAGRASVPEAAQPVYLREGSWKKKDQQ